MLTSWGRVTKRTQFGSGARERAHDGGEGVGLCLVAEAEFGAIVAIERDGDF